MLYAAPLLVLLAPGLERLVQRWRLPFVTYLDPVLICTPFGAALHLHFRPGVGAREWADRQAVRAAMAEGLLRLQGCDPGVELAAQTHLRLGLLVEAGFRPRCTWRDKAKGGLSMALWLAFAPRRLLQRSSWRTWRFWKRSWRARIGEIDFERIEQEVRRSKREGRP